MDRERGRQAGRAGLTGRPPGRGDLASSARRIALAGETVDWQAEYGAPLQFDPMPYLRQIQAGYIIINPVEMPAALFVMHPRNRCRS